MTTKTSYNCNKCPGYCCSYPLIEVSKTDIGRLGRHFGLDYMTAEQRFTYYDKAEKSRGLRKQKDEIFGTICRFFDTDKRRCTVYEARPEACRDYPYSKGCGYWEFLKFERKLQDDKTFVALTT
ncbi:MAG: YkgJ family cysteine cluster protein [Candidatus Parcubacteria bacterium]|nr:YkgJ family cysteine cluster protein [Burkholderiales bacterium]